MLVNAERPGYFDGYFGRAPVRDDAEYLRGFERGAAAARIDKSAG